MITDDERLRLLREKADLVCTDVYKKIAEYQMQYVLERSNTNLDDKYLRGMLMLIQRTNEWENELEDFINSKKK